MKNFVTLGILIGILFSLAFAFAWTDNGQPYQNVSDCGTLSTANAVYTLNQSITTLSDCFSIQANNITLDMNGYNITGEPYEEYCDCGDPPYDNEPECSYHDCTWVQNYPNAIQNLNYSFTLKNGMITMFESIFTEDSKNFGLIINNMTFFRNYPHQYSNPYTCFPYPSTILNSVFNSSSINLGDDNYIENCTFTPEEGTSYLYVHYLNYCGSGNRNKIVNSRIQGEIYLDWGASDNLIKDTNLTGILIVGYGKAATNNTFLNTTHTTENVVLNYPIEIIRKWYYRAYVNNTLGNNVSNANVTALNVSNSYNFNLTTDATGYTQLGEIIDYVNNGSARKYYSLYNMTSEKSGYEPLSHELNASLGNTYKDVFSFVLPVPYINFTYPTPANGTISNNTSFIINISIIDSAVAGIKFNWNGANYTIFNSSVIAKYNFGNISAFGESSSLVSDISGNNHTGAVKNAVWTSQGKSGGAYNFDGNNDYINLSSAIGMSNNSGSVTVWFKKADVTSATAKYIFGHRTGTNNNRIYIYVNGDSDGAKKQSMTCGFGDNVLPSDTTSVQKVNDSQWHFATLTWNSSVMRCYLDAGYVGYYDYSIPALDGLVTVGIAPSLTANLAFNGTIDELTIWNYTLDSSEINQLYFSFLSKYNSTDWNLYINQSKTPAAGLDIGTYSYFASASNANGENPTETRYYTVNGSNNSTNFTGITASDINCNIESGSCANLTIGGENIINFYLVNDDAGTMRYWFMFNITGNASGHSTKFNILNAGGSNFPLTAAQQPVYSYDNGATWSRITNVSYASPVYTFTQTFTQDSGILVAVTFPFKYSDMQTFINSLGGNFINVDNIGNSSQNRTMYLVTITNSSVDSANKKTIWVTTGHHPSETNGMWVARGLIEFLTNTTNETAIDMRNKYIFKINPMINPDGVYLGKTRDNANGIDLNREWDDVTKEQEVKAVFNNISNYTQTQKIGMFMDIHDGDSGSYLGTFTQAYIGADNYSNQTILKNLLKNYTIYSASTQESTTQGTARVEMFDQFAIFPSITLETYSGNTTYTIASLKQQGTKVALAVKDYFE